MSGVLVPTNTYTFALADTHTQKKIHRHTQTETHIQIHKTQTHIDTHTDTHILLTSELYLKPAFNNNITSIPRFFSTILSAF